MTRFRLRFLLQEFDLSGTEIFLGRSPECQITIEDPLVSRKHARIRIEFDRAFVEDLGSRNGVRVNSQPISGQIELKDGDRIRIGTQDLLFTVLASKPRKLRQTGYQRVCTGCGSTYPEGVPSCPHCGVRAASSEETMTGVLVEETGHWSLNLIGEVVDRALQSGKADDAERMLRRTAREMEQMLAAGKRLDATQLSLFSTYVLRHAALTGKLDWLKWTLESHRNLKLLPSSTVVDHLEQLAGQQIPGFKDAMTAFVEWARIRASQGTTSGLGSLARLEKMI